MLTLNNLLMDLDINEISATEAISKYGFEPHVPFTFTEETQNECKYKEFVKNSMKLVFPGNWTTNVQEVTIRVQKDESSASLQAVDYNGEEIEMYFSSVR